MLRWIIEREDGVIWTGLIQLRIGTSGRLLLTSFGFHKMSGTAQLAASQEVLSSVELT
jgi:hypothetical protein